MDRQDVVTSDDHKIGTIVAEQDGFAIVEMGHVFKSKHAIPIEFLHDFGGVQRATVDKAVVAESPKLDGGELDADAVRMHYGLVDVPMVDPETEELGAPAGDRHKSHDRTVFDPTTNSADPAWTTAGLSDRDPERDDAVDRDRHLGEPG